MKRENIKINGSKILLALFEKYKNESWVLSCSDIEDKKNSIFASATKWSTLISEQIFGLKSGITLGGWQNEELCFLWDSTYNYDFDISNLSLNDLKNLMWFRVPNKIAFRNRPGYYLEIKLTEPETKFLKEFIDEFSNEVDLKIKSQERKKEEEIIKKEKELIKENQRIISLKKSQNNFLQELDKDSNDIIDVIEGSDDFMSLFRKHQKLIIDLDKEYIQKFVKISNYLKVKRQNIQDIFVSIKYTKNKSELNNNIGLLKNQVHTYELLLFHSINMITSLVEEDLIVFYEIYESFDKLNMFTGNWENEVSQKLSNIGEGLNDLMFSIDSMERNIVSGLNELSYVSQEGFSNLNKSVTRELQSIDSSIKFNNLLTGISTYQLYKINKQTKGLLK
jgi:hypothetical protein